MTIDSTLLWRASGEFRRVFLLTAVLTGARREVKQ